MDGRDIGACELVVAIFRMAVADAQAVAYGHEETIPIRHVRPRHRPEANDFFELPWAGYLAETIGLCPAEVRRRAATLARLQTLRGTVLDKV